MSIKSVVVGGTGLVGSKVVTKLRAHGHQVVAEAPDTSVDAMTGVGVAEVLQSTDVVVDLSNSPSFESEAVMECFTTSTHNLLGYEARAGVRHYVALSVVGTDRLQESPYIRAKIAQEKLIKQSGIPYSIVHTTQFFEFAMSIADSATAGKQVRVPPVLIQPIASEDVATAVAEIAAGNPLNGMVEFAGPERFRFDEFIRGGLLTRNDPREVVVDPQACYFGATLSERILVADDDARLGNIRFEDWLSPAILSR